MENYMLMQFKVMILSLFMQMGVVDEPQLIKMDNLEDMRSITCLSQAIHGEAGNQPFEGKIAVAHVIVNRTKEPNYPSDICSLLRQKSQFNYIAKVKHIHEEKPAEYAQMLESVKAAAMVMNGEARDPTDGSLYFVNRKIATYTKWLKPLKKTTKIGDHTFYKKA
jgi:N-acetylmuramoyl-L-alanine amidase